MSLVTAHDKIPFNDLAPQWSCIEKSVRLELDRLFAASAFCLGPWVEEFEEAIAKYLDVPHAIGVNSGTSALHLAAVAAGIGSGDEVLVPAQTFIATLWGVLYAGGVPVLCDVDPVTGTINVEAASLRVTSRTKAIIPVHLFGQPADMTGVKALAARHHLIVIEDCAQSIGARYAGRPTGGLGTMGCFSFYPGKNLGAAGEAGLLTTHDVKLAARLRSLRNHGQSEKYRHDEIGFNYRMEGIQALVLSQKLRFLDQWTSRRREIAARYTAGLDGLSLGLPVATNGDHVYHLYVVLHKQRDALRHFLAQRNIETGLHYPIALHQQPCLARYVSKDECFPNAERFAQQGLSLPMFFGLTDPQVDRVIEAIRAFCS
jgi:dTDP-4-amino-4,6-dideoxygalactose transaminase